MCPQAKKFDKSSTTTRRAAHFEIDDGNIDRPNPSIAANHAITINRHFSLRSGFFYSAPIDYFILSNLPKAGADLIVQDWG